MPMADAIENLAQDLNQVGVMPYESLILTDEGYVNTIPNPNFVEPYAYPNPPRFGLPEQPPGMFDPVLDYGSRQWLDRRIRAPEPAAPPSSFEFAPTTPTNPDSQFENYLAGIKNLQAPVSSPSQPYTPTFTPMAAPPAVRVSPPAQFGPVTASGYAQPPVDPMSYYSNPSTASLSNPSTLATGGEIDYNIPDDPTIRTNIGNTDEKDAFVRTGIGTTLDPKTEDLYGVKGLVSPGDLGGTIGVVDANPADFAGQIPSVSQGVVTRGKPVSIPGRGLTDYVPIGQMENGDVLYADRNNIRDTIIRPSAYSISQEDLDKGIVPQKFNFGITTKLDPSQKTPTSVGATEPSTASVGGFDNTGGNVTVGPDNRAAGPGGTVNITPDYKPKPEVKPGDEFKDSPWTIASGNPPRKTIVTPEGVTEGTVVPGTGGIKVGDYYPDDQGNKWNWEKGVWEKDPAQGGTKTPPVTTPPVTTPPVTKPPVITPPGGGQPGGGTPGPGPYTGTPLPPREPVTPLVRREVVIPTKGTKEVPLPDRQADPFAKIYADLLANAQQQKDQYRYINYDPDQIMNAAMSGFRRRGAMRSLQGYY